MTSGNAGVKVCPPSRPQREAALLFATPITSDAFGTAERRGPRYVREWPERPRVVRDKEADKAKRAAILERMPPPEFAAEWPGSWRVTFSFVGELIEREGSCCWCYQRIAEAIGYGRDAVMGAIGGIAALGHWRKEVRPVDGERHLTCRLTLAPDGPMVSAIVGWARKWLRWLRKSKTDPSRDNQDKYHSFLKRLRLWKDELSRAEEPGDLIAWADWYNPPEKALAAPERGFSMDEDDNFSIDYAALPSMVKKFVNQPVSREYRRVWLVLLLSMDEKRPGCIRGALSPNLFRRFEERAERLCMTGGSDSVSAVWQAYRQREASWLDECRAEDRRLDLRLAMGVGGHDG